MSKAKNLGAGSSFAQARPISARRAAIGAATDAPTVGVPDPTELPLHLISSNPDNPREELRDLEGLSESIAAIGLVNAITIATIDAYLAERPDRVADLDEGARYIVIDGHRRLEAARRAGAQTVRVSVDNALVSTDESLLEAAFVANVHRDDMNPLEQAHALRTLVKFYGSQNKAAKRLGIAQSTISSKLSILDLTPELQADLVAGRRTIEHVRNLSKLSSDEQRRQADARAAVHGRKRSKPEDLSRRDNPGGDHASAGAVAGSSDLVDRLPDLSRRDNSGGVDRLPDLSRRDNPEASENSVQVGDDVPAQRAEPATTTTDATGSTSHDKASDQRKVMPWHNGNKVADLVMEKMSLSERKVLIERLLAEHSDLSRA